MVKINNHKEKSTLTLIFKEKNNQKKFNSLYLLFISAKLLVDLNNFLVNNFEFSKLFENEDI